MSTNTPHYRSVQQFLQSQSFCIDEHKRKYNWERENIDGLLSDLQAKFFSQYTPSDETPGVSSYEEYFHGSIIASKRNGKNYRADGHQFAMPCSIVVHGATVASIRGSLH